MKLGLRKCIPREVNDNIKCAFGEFLSTFILVIFTLAPIAQTVLSENKNGYFFSNMWGSGLAVILGAHFGGELSGGHMNPAVTIASAVISQLSWKKVPFYITGQFLGSFAASAALYGVYFDALNNFDGGIRRVTGEKGTAQIWATYPSHFLSWQNAIGDQIFCTALLMSCALAITDNNNLNPHPGMRPFLLGLVVLTIVCSFSFNAGTAMNPARDLPPRIFTAIAGWGMEVFSYNNYNWFWIPIIGPVIGAIIGAFVYRGLIGIHLEERRNLEKEIIGGHKMYSDNMAYLDSQTDILNSSI